MGLSGLSGRCPRAAVGRILSGLCRVSVGALSSECQGWSLTIGRTLSGAVDAVGLSRCVCSVGLSGTVGLSGLSGCRAVGACRGLSGLVVAL